VELPGRSVRVNITLDEHVLDMVDKAAAETGESRSGFLAKAAMERIKGASTAARQGRQGTG